MSRHQEFPTKAIWERLDTSPRREVDWYGLLAEDVQEFMAGFGRDASFPVVRQKIGRSLEGRALETWRFGQGRRRVLVWARQHGDETECTAALLVVLRELAANPGDPVCATILRELDLLAFPTVNPDGMNRCTRQNAMGVDLNREAQYLAQPEGRALVKLKDDFAPDFSFNLHDMCARKCRTGHDAGLISIAFQAGPYDETNSDNDVRLRAKTVIGEMFHVAREMTPQEAICVYKAFYMNRAFGDSMMRWGVPCVLIESGGWHADQGGDEYVIRLHALALLAGLYFVAIGADQPFNNDVYESIPYDVGTHEFDTLFRGARIVDPVSRGIYRADVGVWTELQERRTDPHRQFDSLIKNVGDISEENAADQRDLAGGILFPGLVLTAPGMGGRNDLPTQDQLRPFLEAGVTTLAIPFGPFATDPERAAFLASAYRRPPALNIAAFERVGGTTDILDRMGMTPFHGFAVTDRGITAGDLATFLNTHLPGASLAPPAGGETLAVDLFLVPSTDPSRTRLVLHLDHRHSGNGRDAGVLTAVELDTIARVFRLADRLSVVWGGGGEAPAWLPGDTLPCGVSRNASPTPGFAARILSRVAGLNDGLAATVISSITLAPAVALGLGNHGALRQGFLANVVLLDDSVASAPQAQHPTVVMVNGRVVVDLANPASEVAPRGLWHFQR